MNKQIFTVLAAAIMICAALPALARDRGAVSHHGDRHSAATVALVCGVGHCRVNNRNRKVLQIRHWRHDFRPARPWASQRFYRPWRRHRACHRRHHGRG